MVGGTATTLQGAVGGTTATAAGGVGYIAATAARIDWGHHVHLKAAGGGADTPANIAVDSVADICCRYCF